MLYALDGDFVVPPRLLRTLSENSPPSSSGSGERSSFASPARYARCPKSKSTQTPTPDNQNTNTKTISFVSAGPRPSVKGTAASIRSPLSLSERTALARKLRNLGRFAPRFRLARSGRLRRTKASPSLILFVLATLRIPVRRPTDTIVPRRVIIVSAFERRTGAETESFSSS